jgi:hypothetical protein
LNLSGSITATGTITAQTLVVQTVTSSIDYVTGSTQWGSVIGNTHTITGSLGVSGSMNVNANSLVVNTNGTVSIGNTNSTYNLDVTGTGRFTGALTGTSATFSSSVTANGNITLNVSSGNPTLTIQGQAGAYTSIISMIAAGAGSNKIYASGGSNDFYLNVNGGDRLYINPSGNVGIGTTSPSYTLDVTGTFRATGAATFSSSVTATQGNFNQTATSGFAVTMRNRNANQTWAQVVDVNAVDDKYLGLFDVTNSAYRMVITNNGNVGIGNTSPITMGSTTTLQVGNGTTAGFIGLNNRSGGFTTPASFDGLLMGSAYDVTYIYANNFATSTWRDMYILSQNTIFQTNGSERMRITSTGNTQPGTDNAYSLGVSGTRWSAVWAANGTIQTSDEREKKDIVDSDLGLDFITKLRPVSFKWKVGKNEVSSEIVKDEEGNPILDENGNNKIESVITPVEGKRTHYGLIAQEVEELLDGKDFGGFIHDEETDIKGLRYDQFVPLLIKSIQELKDRLNKLENK